MTLGQSDTVDVPGDSSYWCVTVSWAYESTDKKEFVECSAGCTDHDFYSGDDDPENEGVPAGYRVSTYGIAGGIPGESCMIFLEIQRDRGGISIPELVSHEVGHCFDLSHADYADEFEADKDGIMGWNKPWDIPCYKEWYDLVWGHESPDRFSYQNIADLRSSATD